MFIEFVGLFGFVGFVESVGFKVPGSRFDVHGLLDFLMIPSYGLLAAP